MAHTANREYYNKRVSGMDTERESFIAHYKELAEFIRPRRGRFFIQDRNKGQKKHNSIINSKATKDHQIAVSGMLAGTMSPTRPWFNLESLDPGLMQRQEVKEWLFAVENLMRTILAESNFYGQASTYISELILFATATMSHVDDFEDVARFYTHTAGSYYIAQDERFVVNTVVRKYEWTAEQIVRKFGIENVSLQVKNAINTNAYNAWFPVIHFVEPNNDFRPSSPLAQDKPFKSIYFEPGEEMQEDKFLSISGFDEMPLHTSRWDVTGEDIYGTDCPAMTALGDIKGLQIEEKRKAQGIDKMVNPPLKGPTAVRNTPVNALPGGLTVYDNSMGTTELSPVYQVDPRLQELRADIDAVERRIDSAFFVDLFLAISNMEGIQPRNQLDLIQRNEERLLQLGPVLERIQGEFLDPLINRLFNQVVRADIMPPPPQELGGSSLKIKYISTLAMAQRAVATQSIDRITAYTAGLIEVGFQEAADKFKATEAIDEYARAVGVPPTIVASDEEVELIAQQRAQQQQQEQALLAAQQAAETAKTASQASTEEGNVLSDALNNAG